MNIFIDTNIFLSFYHLSSDDLEELDKLVVLVRHETVNLWLPKQVKVEFERNRANKIADSLKRLKEQRLNLQFPQLCKGYDEYEELRRSLSACEKQFTDLVNKVQADIQKGSLKADRTIQELFRIADEIAFETDVVERARMRFDLGNPPGKNGSLGDGINWESLLASVPDGEALFFISDDRDYVSPLDDSLFDPFLLGEWVQQKNSQLFFYRRLSAFFKEKFPDIKLASEFEKEELIKELGRSSNFAKTHIVVSRLSKYADFTASQVNEIVGAALSNRQVYWIMRDEDVMTFFRNLIEGRELQIDPDNLRVLKQYLSTPETTGEASE